MITISRDGLEKAAASKAQGYLQAVLSVANDLGSGLLGIEESDYARIVREYSTPPLHEQAMTLAVAMTCFVQSGGKVSSQSLIDHRFSVCKACKWWKPGRFLFTCGCSKCGCTGIKLWVESEKCPAGKW